jgi:hypothetical protein
MGEQVADDMLKQLVWGKLIISESYREVPSLS